MTPVPDKPRIELGLRTIAICSGNRRRAARVLEERGTPISLDTLRSWHEKYPDRYEEIESEVTNQLYERMAKQSEGIAIRAAEVESDLIEHVADNYESLSASAAAVAAKNLSVTRGISVDKSLILRGRPTSITATADITDLLLGLKNRFGDVVEVTGVEEENDEGPAEASP